MGKENKNSLPPLFDYQIDNRGIITYRDPVEKRIKTIQPAEPITDTHIVIGKIGQQNLLPNHFTIKPKDFEDTIVTTEDGSQIGEPVRPGISTFLFWGSKYSNQNSLSSIAQSSLGREITRKNRLYVTQVGDIYNAGWTPYFVPLIDRNYSIYNPQHVIIVPNTFLGTLNRRDAGQVEKESLAEAFLRWDNYEL